MCAVKILIVDDELIGHQLLDAILQREKYETFLADNGFEAIEICKKHHPDLILLDIMMPVMNGFETIHEIKKNTEIQDIPIIILTALEDRDSRIKGLEMGANDFISKPFDRIELVSKIKNYTSIKTTPDAKSQSIQNKDLPIDDAAELIEEINNFYTKTEYKEFKILNVNDTNFDTISKLYISYNNENFILLFGINEICENFIFQKSLITLWIVQHFQSAHGNINSLCSYIKSKISASERFKGGYLEWWLMAIRIINENSCSIAGFNRQILLNNNWNGSFELSELDEFVHFFKGNGERENEDKLILIFQKFNENFTQSQLQDLATEIRDSGSSLTIENLKFISEKVSAKNAFIVQLMV